MRLKGRLAVPALVLMVSVCGSGWAAQEIEEAEPQPEAQASEQQDEAKKDWLKFYVYASRGTASVDPMNASIKTSANRNSENTFTMEDQVYSKAAFGWKLDKAKGDFRLVFTGFKEDGYELTAAGRDRQVVLVGPPPPGGSTVEETLDWWTVHVVDGNLSSTLAVPQWTSVEGDRSVERSEVFYGEPELEVSRTISDDLQNRMQALDIVYGRDFGKRRYTGHWWGGLRYSVYEGNVPAAAWLKPTGVAEGYTDGAFLKFLNFHQEFSGGGPTGAIEFDFNFLADRISLFVGAQFAFMFGNVETDSGDFATLVVDDDLINTIAVPARLQEKREKSVWQTAAEAGVKINLKSGLQFELAYNISGHLDVVLLPTEIRIPSTEFEAGQGTSALYNTQDLVLDGWRAGVAFQF
jgi:hypothetical protein